MTVTARGLRGSIVLAVSLLYFCDVFQVWRGDFLRSGLSGWLDPYFLNYLLEHWYHSLWHLTDPASPSMYFPAPGVLGYSCGVILFAPFYVLVRPFMHPFTAYTVALFLVMETGSLCLYAVFRKFVGLACVESLVLTAFFVSSKNVINSWHTNVWAQTASIFLVPPILLLTLVAVRMPARWPGLWLTAASGLLWTLLFAQDFYTGWLVLLVASLVAAGVLLVAPKRPMLQQIGAIWHTRRPFVVALAGGALAGTLVFAWIYVGAYRERQGFPEQQLLATLIPINVPDWSHPIDAFRRVMVFASARPFQLVTLIALLAWMPWSKVPWRVRLYTIWFVVISSVVALVAIKFNVYQGWRNYSFWKQLFRGLPGYAVIRDPKRVIYAYELVVVLVAGVFLAQLPRRSLIRVSAVLLAFALIVAEPNREVFHYARPAALYDRWVQAPIDVDRSCRSFVVKRASANYESRPGSTTSIYGLDAAFIALNLSIPTLNGYSAWPPPNWSLADPTHPWYPDAVRDWIARHRLKDVCELDLDARTMRPYR